MNRFLNWLMVFIILAGITYFSQQEFSQQDLSPYIQGSERLVQGVQDLPQVTFSYNNRILDSHADTVAFIQFVIRKLAHLTMYGLFGLSLLLAVGDKKKNKLLTWILIGIVVLLVACADEINQLFMGSRTGCKEDILMDFTGYILFSTAYLVVKGTGLLSTSQNNHGS